MKCERCNKEHNNKFGSGRFCSQQCSRARKLSSEAREKISKSLKKYQKEHGEKHTLVCEKCKNSFISSKGPRKNRKTHCEECKRKVPHQHLNPQSILDFSKRTIKKILKRANCKCKICGYDRATCDIHHIVAKSKGGPDSTDNLIIVCPNCHREIHDLKQWKVEDLREMSIANTFPNWKDYYYKN